MNISFFSIMMANLLVTCFTIIICVMQRDISTIVGIGVKSFLFIYFLCILRLLFPIELPMSKVIPAKLLYNSWSYYLNEPVFGHKFKWMHVLIAIWICVSIILLIRYLVKYYNNIHWVSFFSLVKNKQIDTFMENNYKNVDYYIIPAQYLYSPMQIGLLNPIILFPNIDYEYFDLDLICTHEMTHFKNHDNMVKICINLITCMFWWNPILYYLIYKLDEILELKCDYVVCKTLTNSQKSKYLNMILKLYKNQMQVLKECNMQKSLQKCSVALFLPTKKTNIVQRFQFVANQKKEKRLLPHVIRLFCVVIVCCSYIFILQPKYDIPLEQEEGIMLNPNDTKLKPINNNEYQIIHKGHTILVINKDTAMKLLDIGISCLEE